MFTSHSISPFLRTTACVFVALVSCNLAAQTTSPYPYCEFAGSDADGNGWGWENNRSCIVPGSAQDFARVQHPDCRTSDSDPDGDGYGWEDGKTCLVVVAKEQTSHPLCASPSSDPDGDGYGWENNRTCSVGGGEGDLPICSSENTDPDGDGYGYENDRSCIVRATVDYPDCESSDSDPDGDGYGEEEGNVCVVVTAKQEDEGLSVDAITEVILVTGQSNVAAAQTGFDAFLDLPNDRVFAYTDQGWQIADLHQAWDLHGAPGNFSTTTPNRDPNNSFAFHFGKTVANKSADRVPAIIVAAASGTGISNWDYGSAFYQTVSNKVARALKDIPHKFSVDAVLWHQGENDWLYEGTADAGATGFTSKESDEYRNYYAIKLDALIKNFRNETWARGDTAFICGETRRAEGVNRRLMALNSDQDPLTGCVAATDLPKRTDDPYGSHFSAEGLRTLGGRYADEYLRMTGN